MVTKHHKSAARILNRDCINRGGLDPSKEVLWVSVGQRAAALQVISPVRAIRVRTGAICSTSLERSKPLLLTQSMSKSLAALLIHFISVQSDLISIVLMY